MPNLMLSRKQCESIVYRVPPSDVEQEIVITVEDIRGERVWILSTAPKAVTVNRREVQDAIDQQREVCRD